MTMAKTEAFELQRKLEAALKEVRLFGFDTPAAAGMHYCMGVQSMWQRKVDNLEVAMKVRKTRAVQDGGSAELRCKVQLACRPLWHERS